jgi:DNA-binding NtrC family response regulator
MSASPQDEIILVIDDDECIRDSCHQTLSKAGYCVETAVNGEAGLSIAGEIGPDIALVDLQMPGISGLEVMKQLGRISPKTLKLIVTGSHSIDLVMQIIEEQRASGCLFKPFSPDELKRVVRRALDGKH